MGTTPAGVSVNDTYTYNGLGMRQTAGDVSPLTDGQTTGSPILVNEGITYTPGISRSGGPNGSLFYLTDGHDEVLGQTDSAWSLDDDIRYNPWGDQIKHGGSAPTGVTQGWGVEAAYQQDGDTDLILMGSRYYDPSLGRFLSQDPAGAGNNWYEYCGNDPLGGEDPDGLDPDYDVQPAAPGQGDPSWLSDPAGYDPGSTYYCPGYGMFYVGANGMWDQGSPPTDLAEPDPNAGLSYPAPILDDSDFTAASTVAQGATDLVTNVVTGVVPGGGEAEAAEAIAARVAPKFPIGQCVKCAGALVKAFKKAGIQGTIMDPRN